MKTPTRLFRDLISGRDLEWLIGPGVQWHAASGKLSCDRDGTFAWLPQNDAIVVAFRRPLRRVRATRMDRAISVRSVSSEDKPRYRPPWKHSGEVMSRFGVSGRKKRVDSVQNWGRKTLG